MHSRRLHCSRYRFFERFCPLLDEAFLASGVHYRMDGVDVAQKETKQQLGTAGPGNILGCTVLPAYKANSYVQ